MGGEDEDATVDDEEMAIGDVVVAVDAGADIELVEEVVLATDRGTRWITMVELRPWRCLLKADDRQFVSSAPVNAQNDEVAAFEYTEEMVAIMQMGFSDMGEIKRLLNEHKGNKQNVVQELVSVQ